MDKERRIEFSEINKSRCTLDEDEGNNIVVSRGLTNHKRLHKIEHDFSKPTTIDFIQTPKIKTTQWRSYTQMRPGANYCLRPLIDIFATFSH